MSAGPLGKVCVRPVDDHPLTVNSRLFVNISAYPVLLCYIFAIDRFNIIAFSVIDFDGAKPINPSGGLIGCGHPVGGSGARMFVDLYKQVTGKAGGYQVKGAKNGMMLNIGGSATTNYVFIVGKE